MLLGKDRARELVDGALGAAGEGDAECVFAAGRAAVTRFAMNRIHQNVAEEDARASFRVAVGSRVGGARTNQTRPARLAECARRAAQIARVQAEDPDFPGLAKSPPAKDRGDTDFDGELAQLSPEARAKAVMPAIEKAIRSKDARVRQAGLRGLSGSCR